MSTPLVIAHRGYVNIVARHIRSQWLTEPRYKDKYPENTLIGFKGAVDAGVDVLETGELRSWDL